MNSTSFAGPTLRMRERAAICAAAEVVTPESKRELSFWLDDTSEPELLTLLC